MTSRSHIALPQVKGEWPLPAPLAALALPRALPLLLASALAARLKRYHRRRVQPSSSASVDSPPVWEIQFSCGVHVYLWWFGLVV